MLPGLGDAALAGVGYGAYRAAKYGYGRWKGRPRYRQANFGRYNTRGNWNSASALAKRVAKMSANMGEWKNHDTGELNQSITNAGTIQYLSDIAQGTQSIDRIGLTINLQSIAMRLNISQDVNIDNTTLARVILFFDTQGDGTTPTIAELLEGATPTVLSFREHDEKGRFQIIFDKTYEIQNLLGSTIRNNFDKYYKKFNGRKITFKGTGNTVGSSGKGSLWIAFISDKSTSDYPLLDYQVRLKYTDN